MFSFSLLLAFISILQINRLDCRVHLFHGNSPVSEEEYRISADDVKLDLGQSGESFPNDVTVQVTAKDEIFNYKFIKMQDTTPKDQKISRQLYREDTGLAQLTLLKTPKNERALIILTVHMENAQFTFTPRTFDSLDSGYNVVVKNTKLSSSKFDKVELPPGYKAPVNDEEDDLPPRRRRQSSTPIRLFTEVTVVIGPSVYNKYRAVYPSLSDDLFTEYLQIHYQHLMTAADLRYTNSFASDTQLKLSVRLKNLLIRRNIVDAPWENPAIVTVSTGVQTNANGKIVIDYIKSLNSFTSFMANSGFVYDHAIAIMDVDMWDGTSPGVLGVAWLSTICTKNSISLSEDFGFNSIDIVAHEIGHSLSALHDADTSSALSKPCPITDNFIMAPSIGQSVNIQNRYIFSSCSINQFKRHLLINKFRSVNTFNAGCLTNQPSPMPGVYYQSGFLSGRLWNLNDQCRLIAGAGSSSCTLSRPLCQSIACTNPSNGICSATWGWGAADGTPGCDLANPNRICYKTQCVDPSTVPLIGSNLPPSCACQNGGVCNTVSGFYLCECQVGYTGLNCETVI